MPFLAPAIPALAGVIGGLAGGRSQGKQVQADTGMQQDRLAQSGTQIDNSALLNEMEARMKAGGYNLDMQGKRASQAVRGDIMANVQDVQATHPRANIVHFQGGLRPSLMSQGTRDLGRRMATEGAARYGTDDVAAPQLKQTPGLTPLPQSGLLDKILSVAGPALSIYGAVNSRRNPTGGGASGLQSPTSGGYNMPQF